MLKNISIFNSRNTRMSKDNRNVKRLNDILNIGHPTIQEIQKIVNPENLKKGIEKVIQIIHQFPKDSLFESSQGIINSAKTKSIETIKHLVDIQKERAISPVSYSSHVGRNVVKFIKKFMKEQSSGITFPTQTGYYPTFNNPFGMMSESEITKIPYYLKETLLEIVNFVVASENSRSLYKFISGCWPSKELMPTNLLASPADFKKNVYGDVFREFLGMVGPYFFAKRNADAGSRDAATFVLASSLVLKPSETLEKIGKIKKIMRQHRELALAGRGYDTLRNVLDTAAAQKLAEPKFPTKLEPTLFDDMYALIVVNSGVEKFIRNDVIPFVVVDIPNFLKKKGKEYLLGKHVGPFAEKIVKDIAKEVASYFFGKKKGASSTLTVTILD